MSSVVTVRRLAPAATGAAKACGSVPTACTRSGTAVTASAHTAASRSPHTNSTRSHQCEPMSANARDCPAELGVDPPVVVVLGGEPVLQVAAVQQAHRPDGAGRHPGAGLADQRVEAVDEGHGRDRARRVGGRHEAAGVAASTASGFSQTTCLPAARAAAARSACRWLGVQTWTTSTSGLVARTSAWSNASSAPRRRAAARPRSGVEAATPTRRAPARRTARAWTSPMKPVPTMAARRGARRRRAGVCRRAVCRSSPPRL